MAKITSQSEFSVLARSLNLYTFQEVLVHLKQLPYGRNSDRSDFRLPLIEGKGTCSSKHAAAHLIAQENNIPTQLHCVLYKMHGENTSASKKVFDKHDLEYIPEAHCVLYFEDEFLDLTFEHSNYQTIEKDVLQTMPIEPNWLIEEKIAFHQEYIKKWLAYSGISNRFDEIWKIREEIIGALGT